jgi:HupE / UreJ protein
MKAFLPHIGWFVRGFIAVLLLTATGAAVAHDVPPSMVTIDIGRRTLNLELQLPLSELGTALQLPLAADPQSAVSQYSPQIQRYIQERLKVHTPDDRPYTLHISSLGLRQTHELNWTSNDWLVVQTQWQAPENVNTETFVLDDSLIVHRVVSHKSLIYVRRDIRNGLLGDKPVLIGVIGFGTTLLRVDGSDGTWWHGFSHLFSLGMQHIAEGTDHLLFLLALLLPAPLRAVGRRWRTGKSTGASVRTIVTVVSGFTVGHSLTLALASVGWLQVPTHTIEVLIAVSIVISSLHAWRPLFAGKEIWLASAFGLIHGLAFAETLSGLSFDGYTLALSLLGFNLGIESMQLLVILATLPLLIVLSQTNAYPAIRASGALFAATCATGWILERAFALPNPLQNLVNWLAAPPNWLILAVCFTSAVSIVYLGARVTVPTRPPSTPADSM